MLKWPTADTSRPKVADGRHPPTNCAKAAAACAGLTSPPTPGPRSAGRANVLKWATSGAGVNVLKSRGALMYCQVTPCESVVR